MSGARVCLTMITNNIGFPPSLTLFLSHRRMPANFALFAKLVRSFVRPPIQIPNKHAARRSASAYANRYATPLRKEERKAPTLGYVTAARHLAFDGRYKFFRAISRANARPCAYFERRREREGGERERPW